MTSTELEIRRATLDDVSAIARVHVKTWQVAYRGQMPDSFLDGLSEERRVELWRPLLQPRDHGVLVATWVGAVIGFCDAMRSRDDDATPYTGEVAALYVDPAHWGRGAGHALLTAGVERARAAGHHTLTLWVLATNVRARRFYEREGFSADGSEKHVGRGEYALHEVRYRRPL